MAAKKHPDRVSPGYAKSGRQQDDLAFAVTRLSEFCQRYRDERDEYRALVQRLEGDLAIAIAANDRHEQRAADERFVAQIQKRRAGHWKEAARHYRERYHRWLDQHDALQDRGSELRQEIEILRQQCVRAR